MPGLRITDIEHDLPRLNEFIAEQEAAGDERDRQIDRLTTQGNSTETEVTGTATDNAIPPSVTSPSDSESGRTIDGVVFSEVTFTYNAPSPLKNFQGVFVVVQNYLGSAELVKVHEHTFTGAAGGAVSFLTTLQRTGETVTYFLVAKTSTGVTVEDWTTEPTGTVVLDGDVSAPNAPTGAAASVTSLGVTVTWSENSESNLFGYNLYRHTADVFGSATKIATIPATRSGAPSYFDNTGVQGTTYWFWPIAVNTAGQESAEPTGVNALMGAVGAHSTYRPTTNPLTASGTTITIAAFTNRVAGSDISISGGSVTSLTADTLYFVYYDDPSLAGGSVTFAATTIKETALNDVGRFFIGSILMPETGAPDTVGNNDGGSGAQFGQSVAHTATATASAGTGADLNLSNMIDADWDSFGEKDDNGEDTAVTSGTIRTKTFSPGGNLHNRSGLRIRLKYRLLLSVAVGTPTVTAGVAFGSFSDIDSISTGGSDSGVLTVEQAIADTDVNGLEAIGTITYTGNAGGDRAGATVRIYESEIIEEA